MKNNDNKIENDILNDYNDFHYKKEIDKDVSYKNDIPKEFYKLSFENVYWEIKQDRELAKKISEIRNNYEERIFELQTRETEAFNEIVDFSKRRFLKEIVILIEKIFDKQKINYQEEDFSSFYRLENNQKVLYYFTWSLHEDVFKLMEEKEKLYELSSVNEFDKIKIVALVEIGARRDSTTRTLLENYDRNVGEKYNIKIERGTLRAFFNQFFDKTEYDNFYRELKEFNKRVNDMIGYATVTLPSSGERLEEFKNRCKNELKEYDYKKILGNRNINVRQRDLIIRNYLDNENFLYILGSNNFSESFLSSEWYYKQNFSKGLIEKTAIVVGYLKSIEQLLYQINLLSLDKGLKIMAKTEVLQTFQQKI